MPHIDPKMNVDLWLLHREEHEGNSTNVHRQKSSTESRQQLRRTVFEHVVLQQSTSAPPCTTMLHPAHRKATFAGFVQLF